MQLDRSAAAAGNFEGCLYAVTERVSFRTSSSYRRRFLALVDATRDQGLPRAICKKINSMARTIAECPIQKRPSVKPCANRRLSDQ